MKERIVEVTLDGGFKGKKHHTWTERQLAVSLSKRDKFLGNQESGSSIGSLP